MSGISEKVVIPREVAKAIEAYVIEYDVETLIRAKSDREGVWASRYKALADVDLMTVVSAVMCGYIIEQTPEERRLRERFDTAVSWARGGDNYAMGVVSGVKETLNTLGITIEGIND